MYHTMFCQCRGYALSIDKLFSGYEQTAEADTAYFKVPTLNLEPTDESKVRIGRLQVTI